MKSLSKTIAVQLLVIVLVACNTQTAPRQPHAADAPVLFRAESDNSIAKLEVNNLSADQLQKLAESINNPEQLNAKVITPLSKYVLNAAVIESPNKDNWSQLLDVLHPFNTALWRWAKMVKPEKAEPLLIRYAKTVFSGCRIQGNDCANLNYFKTDHLTPHILLIYIENLRSKLKLQLNNYGDNANEKCVGDSKCVTFVSRYYNLLALTILSMNSVPIAKLDTYYLEYSILLNSIIRSAPKLTDLMTSERHQSMFDIIRNRTDLSAANSSMREFVDRPEVYALQPGRDQFFQEGIQQVAFTNYLYTCPDQTFIGIARDCPNSVLSKNFLDGLEMILSRKKQGHQINYQGQDVEGSEDAQAVKKEEEILSQYFSVSFEQVVNELRSLPSPQGDIIGNLGIDLSFNKNEYFYLVNALYMNSMSLETAKVFWNSSKKDVHALHNATLKYAQIQMLRLIVTTNQYMNSIYRDYRLRKDFSAQMMLQTAVTLSRRISQVWSDYRQRLENINRLLIQIDTNEKGTVVDIIRNFSASIKYAAVYPHMMMAMYYMKNANWYGTINHFLFGTVYFSGNRMIRNMIDGTSSQIFLSLGLGNTAEDRLELEGTQILLATYFTFATETLKAYSNLPEVGSEEKNHNSAPLDEVQFFNLFVEGWYKSELSTLVNENDAFKRDLNNQRFKNAIDKCSQLNQLVPTDLDPEWGVKLGHLADFDEDDLDFSNLSNYLFLGSVSGATGKGIYEELAIAYGASRNQVRLEKYQTQLEQSRMYVQLMVNLLKYYYKTKIERTKDSKRKIDLQKEAYGFYRNGVLNKGRIAQVEDKMAELSNERTTLITLLYQALDKVGRCMDVVSYVNRNRIHTLLSAEKVHLQRVHAWMKILSQISDRSTTLEQVSSQTNDVYLKEAIQPLLATMDHNLAFVDAVNAYLKLLTNDSRIPDENRPLPTSLPEKVYKGFDEIKWVNGNWVYLYSSVDFYMRTVTRLVTDPVKDSRPRFQSELAQEVAPNLGLKKSNGRIGDNIMETFKPESSIAVVGFESDREKFVATAMNYISGQNKVNFTSWGKSLVPLRFAFERVELLANLGILGPQKVFGDAKDNACKIKKQNESFCRDIDKMRLAEVTPEKLYREQMMNIYLLNHSAQDVESLNWLNNQLGLYDAKQEIGENLFDINHTEENPLNLFDSLIQKVSRLALLETGPTVPFRAGFLSTVYAQQRNLDDMIFGIDLAPRKIIKCGYLTVFEQALKFYDGMVERASKAETSNPAQLINLRFDMNPEHLARSSFNDRNVLYNRQIEQNIRGEIEKFHLNLRQYFNRNDAKTINLDNGDPKSALELYFPTADECKKEFDEYPSPAQL